MGLAIVRGIVDAHGGRVWLEPAEPGAGATFSIAIKPGVR
jgi:signal transduction histidine kinase